jgi:glycerophosphoryl diester phosphodiesterase
VVVNPIPRPLLLGHRGVRSLRLTGARAKDLPAENTLAAFEYALAHSCDGFEFDVRFTRDRRAVLCHDPQIAGHDISATDYSDLRRNDLALPCLKDVLARFGKTAYLDIELKMSGHEEAVIGVLQAGPPERGYVVSSFLPEVLLRVNQLDSSVPLGYICDRPQYVAMWEQLPVTVFIPHHRLVSEKLIAATHRRHVKLFAWTVNQRRHLLRLAAWGVDGLISDDPMLLSHTFAQRP